MQLGLFLCILVITAEGLKGEPSVPKYLYKLGNLSVGLQCEISCCRKISGTPWLTVNKSVIETVAHRLIFCNRM